MKRILLALFIIAAASTRAAPYITIGNLKLFQAYAPADSPVQLREYVPAGESIEKWTHLASIRVFKNQTDPELYLMAVAGAVMKSHPAARYQFLHDDTTNVLILDFMTFPPESVSPQYAEWNLMRAAYVKGKGLVVYQYAMRIYDLGPQTGPIITAERNKMADPFAHASFEESNEPNQRPEPTARTVTPRAGARVAPAPAVAHP